MKPLDKKTIGISFNIADPYQKKMYDFVQEKTNMSNYLKRLIDHDMNGVKTELSSERSIVIKQPKVIEQEHLNTASSFI